MTNVLLDGFSNYWHRRKSSMKTTQGERPPALCGCPQLRSVPSLWSGIGEQSRSISRGLKINKNSAEGEVFLVDFPSYRTFQAVRFHLFEKPVFRPCEANTLAKQWRTLEEASGRKPVNKQKVHSSDDCPAAMRWPPDSGGNPFLRSEATVDPNRRTSQRHLSH